MLNVEKVFNLFLAHGVDFFYRGSRFFVEEHLRLYYRSCFCWQTYHCRQ